MDELFPIRQERCIYLNRTIDLDLYNELFPRICELRESSKDPIYIYLDSLGGSVSLSEKLHELLRAPRFDGSVCDVVTIVPQLAASAAADLAILGDFCTVFPAGIIHCHGTRLSDFELTADNVDDVGAHIRSSNEDHALKLAQSVSSRLAFQIWRNKIDLLTFAEKRVSDPPSIKKREDLIVREELASIYFDRLEEVGRSMSLLSPNGVEFVERCNERWKRKRKMLDLLIGESEAQNLESHQKHIAAKLMNQAIEAMPESSSSYEIARRVVEDATLLGEAIPGGHMGWEDLAESQGVYFLRPEEEVEFDKLGEGELADFLVRKTKSEVIVNYLITTNLCQTLHESENRFSATDAYHLGLADEIYGMSHLYPSIRSIHEDELSGEARD